MTGKSPVNIDHKSAIINHWIEKARESMETAKSEFNSGRNTTAVRNLYYACFYALTAVLLKEGHSFKKHTAVKAALHKELIKAGIVEPVWGKFYNKVFDSRHEGDYQPLRIFEAEEVKVLLDQGAGFITQMEALLIR
jgi:uncharacterized protein (UPF0332 family)